MVAEDLDWSIRPLFLWMNLLGIDFSLDIPGWRYCGKIWTTFCFLFCAVSHILQFEQVWRTRHDYAATYGDSRTTVSLTHVVISYAKTGVQWLGYHLLLLFVCTYTWIEVRRSFKTIERRLIISQDDRRLTRRLSIAGIVYICVLIGSLSACLVVHNILLTNWSWSVIFLECLVTSMKIYAETASIFFCISAWLSATHMRTLWHQINIFRDSLDISTLEDGTLAIYLRSWNDSYCLIHDSIKCLNNCFGPILLHAFVFNFISAIITAFYVWRSVMLGDDLDVLQVVMLLMFLSIPLRDVWLLTYAADQITSEGRKIVEALRQLQLAFPFRAHQLAISVQIVQTSASIPRINILGMVNLGRNQIPQLIGTTLTYLFILCQFLESERALVQPQHPE